MKDIAVVHHTDCGMLRISTEEIRAGPKNIPEGMHFHEFSDIEEGVRRDVRWLKERVQDGALLEGTNVVGYLLENETGKASRCPQLSTRNLIDTALQLRVIE